MNKLCRDPPGDATYQISRLYSYRPYGFGQEDLFMFFTISLCKTCDPWGGAIFGPMGMISTNLAEFHQVMLHTKYQDSRPYGFRQKDFSCFYNISLCKTCDPPGRGHFWPQGHNLNKFGRGLLGDAAYQISML